MVPAEDVGFVLKEYYGSIGRGVSSATGHRSFGPKGEYAPPFWIEGPNGKRFETLVHTWEYHDKTVILPDTAMLEHFRLMPRVDKDGNMLWDDPARRVDDVVRVTPLSHYLPGSGHTVARVSIRQNYLEEYLSQKECSAVATYFDERFSFNDPEVAALIDWKGGEFLQPGRELWFKRVDLRFANQISQVWACALLLNPPGGPIS